MSNNFDSNPTFRKVSDDIPRKDDVSSQLTSAERSIKDYGAQKLGEARDTIHRLAPTAHEMEIHAHDAKVQTQHAFIATRRFVRQHPLVSANIILLAFLTGMIMANVLASIGWMGRSHVGVYPRNSPQWRAHEALDTVLNTAYTGSDRLGQGWTATRHRAEDAYHYLGDTLHHLKDKVSGSNDNIYEAYGKPAVDHGKGLFSDMADTIGYWTGLKHRSKFEEAEHRLRDALRLRG